MELKFLGRRPFNKTSGHNLKSCFDEPKVNIAWPLLCIRFLYPFKTWSCTLFFARRDNSARMITSLPVSPSSSPLRQFEPAYRSCFLSPPHPSYALVGQSNYNLHDYSVHPLRHNTTYVLDPWRENPQFKTQTPPGGSPRVRQIWLDLSRLTMRGGKMHKLCSKEFGCANEKR